MHSSALFYGRKFFEIYFPLATGRILDLGSLDVNGSLRDVSPEGVVYLGCDHSAGKGVDVVVPPGKKLPFTEGEFDGVVSTSCLEHDGRFWETIPELARVLSEGGLLYLNAPSDGEFHRYPKDYWRFYPDAGRALEGLAQRSGYPLNLIESFWGQQDPSGFTDCVMVFSRGEKLDLKHERRIWKEVPAAWNVIEGQAQEVTNHRRLSSDRVRLQRLKSREAVTGLKVTRPVTNPHSAGGPNPTKGIRTGNDRWPVLLPGNRNPRCTFDRASLTDLQRSSVRYEYRGFPCLKNPLDLAIYTRLFADYQPRSVIEIGSYGGGSAIWFADQQRILGLAPWVLSLDLKPVREVQFPGVSYACADAENLCAFLTPERLAEIPRPLLVVEDSSHLYQTCRAVLDFFHPVLKKGEIIVIEDGSVGDFVGEEWTYYANGPNRAIADFLARESRSYRICSEYCDMFGHNNTFNPNGYLQKRFDNGN